MPEIVDAAWRTGTVNIGLFGYLNPRIFEPEWFIHRGLVDAEDAKSAEVSPDSPTIVGWGTDWFQLEVSLDRFLIWGPVESRDRIRRLTQETFAELRHTPIVGVGLSYEFHIQYATLAAREAVLNQLAPDSYWQSLFGHRTDRRLNMLALLDEHTSKRCRVVAEESVMLDNAIYLAVNTERLPDDPDIHVEGCAEVLLEVDAMWDEALGWASEVVNHMAGVSGA